MTAIDVRCVATADGWRCEAAVDDGRSAGRHVVTVRQADAERLLGGDRRTEAADAAAQATSVEGLVRDTFGFLLAREPRSSILASFDITVVSRYFPEFDDELRRRGP